MGGAGDHSTQSVHLQSVNLDAINVEDPVRITDDRAVVLKAGIEFKIWVWVRRRVRPVDTSNYKVTANNVPVTSKTRNSPSGEMDGWLTCPNASGAYRTSMSPVRSATRTSRVPPS